MSMHTEWVETSGGTVECEQGVEVSPLVSYAGDKTHRGRSTSQLAS